MSLDSDIQYLANFKQFGSFLRNVRELREEAIGAMQDASTDKLQQISGQILAFDRILGMTNAEDTIRRSDDLP